MHMIEAVVKPDKLAAIKTALANLGIRGVTALECKGFGRQMGHIEGYHRAKRHVDFVPKVLLKVCVESSDYDRAVDAIVTTSRSGEVGDGKVFISPLAKVLRIGTGEQDESAL